MENSPQNRRKKGRRPGFDTSPPVVRTRAVGRHYRFPGNGRLACHSESRLRRKVWIYLHYLRHRQDFRRNAHRAARTDRARRCGRTPHRRRRTKQNYRAAAEEITHKWVICW